MPLSDRRLEGLALRRDVEVRICCPGNERRGNSDYSINSSDEVLTETLFDGAGRVRKTRTANPGSTGGYTGKLVEYDILGRLKRETVPTEINSSWDPAGDDYRGMDGSNYVWLWNSKEYDWKDRVTRTIPSDSSGTDGKDTLIEYAGCGCSGGQVTTIKGPKVTAYDVGSTFQTTEKRPWKKIYEDPLGRTEKTEIWDLDGAGSAPYSTLRTTFNGRDQATLIRQYSGGDSSTTFQDTTMSFDGHGRLATKHVPEYNSSTNTAWTYNQDDTVASLTDPRGAAVTYEYGHVDDSGSSEYRALLSKIIYTSPNSTTIPDPTDVVLIYDAAGNRTYMSDESGNLTYTYDELSRLQTETKNFADTLSSAPSGGYVLTYDYHLTGGLKSMTGPFGHEINYSSDSIGRITAVGNGASSTAYASAVAHRSFGGIKSASLNATDPIAISLTYDSALRTATYEADSAANSGKLHEATYAYSKDGMLSTLDNQADAKFDQVNKFDFAGRLKVNDVGTIGVANPFAQTLSYDAFDNLTHRVNSSYSLTPVSFSTTYANNRKTSGGNADYYDAAGNVVESNQSNPSDSIDWKFDVAGRQSRWEEFGPYGNTVRKGGENTFDGDGRPVKIANLTKASIGGVWGSWNSVAEFYIYSSVTGQKVTSVDSYGAHYRTHVHLGAMRIADERNGSVWFNLTDPLSGSTRETDEAGALPTGDEEETRNELAGLGITVPLTSTPAFPPPNYKKGSAPVNAKDGCVVYGTNLGPDDCSKLVRQGLATACPKNSCDPVRVRYNGKGVLAPVIFTADGYVGHMPANARYKGKGIIAPIGKVLKGKARRNDTNLNSLNNGEYELDLARVGAGTTGTSTARVTEGADWVAMAVDRAVNILLNKCWTAELDNGVAPLNSSFASLDENVTKGWESAPSVHNNAAVESPVVASYFPNAVQPITDRGMVSKIGNGTMEERFDFLVKYYPGEGAAVTSPTNSAAHKLTAPAWYVGLETNVHMAKNFIAVTKDKECKK